MTTKVLAARYLPAYRRRIDNVTPKALGGTGDYYDLQLLNPNGEGGIHAAYGGLLRDRPAPVAKATSGDFEAIDMAWEVATAKTYHLNAFVLVLDQIDLTSGITTSGVPVTSRLAKKLLAAAQAAGSFDVILAPDMTALSGASAADLATTCANLAAAYPCVRKEGGNVVLMPHAAESKATSYWTSVLTAMSSAGHAAVLVPCFDNYEANVAAFVTALGSGMVGATHFGLRSPAGNSVIGTKARISDAHGRSLFWCQPVRFQDARPHEAVYAESANSLNLRQTFQAAIEGSADWVLGESWNDFPRGTQLCPTAANSNVVTELFSWHGLWWLNAAQPAIVHDSLILTHRRQFAASKPTFAETSLMVLAESTPAQDRLEVFCRLVTAGQVTLNSGTNTQTFNAPAGVSSYSIPLQAGAQSASLARVPVPPPPTPGLTAWADLTTKSDISATLDQASGVLMPSGTFDFTNFGKGAMPNCEGMLLNSLTDLEGAGVDATFFEMVANSSTRAAYANGLVPYNTNQLNYMLFNQGSSKSGKAVTLKDFTVKGTPQGHLYNGLRINGSKGPTIQRVKVKGIPGGAGYPPYEVFPVTLWQCAMALLDTLTVDGRDYSGALTSSSLVGINSTDTYTISNFDLEHSHAMCAALWHSTNAVIKNGLMRDCWRPINVEQCGGTLLVDHVDFGDFVNAPGNSAVIQVNSYAGAPAGLNGSVKVTINEPTWTPNPAYGGRFCVGVPANYPDSSHVNTQKASDITLIVGGVPRPDLLQIV